MQVIVHAEDRSGRGDGYYTKPDLNAALDVFFGPEADPVYADRDAETRIDRSEAADMFSKGGSVAFHTADGERVEITRDRSASLDAHDRYLIDVTAELAEYRRDSYRDTLWVTRGRGGEGLKGAVRIAERLKIDVVVVPWQDVDAYISENAWTDGEHVYQTTWWAMITKSPLVAIFDPPTDRPDLIDRFERFIDSEGDTLVVVGVDEMPDGLYARREGMSRLIGFTPRSQAE